MSEVSTTSKVSSPSKANYRIWRASPDAAAGIVVGPNEVRIVGDKNNFFVANELGTVMQGNTVTINSLSENYRIGGLFIKMNDFVQMIPQTIVTTVPNNVPFPPIAFGLKTMMDLPAFIAFLG